MRPDDETQRKFEAYHANNPHIYNLFVGFAREARSYGREKYSIWMIGNRVRWHVMTTTKGQEEYKISNGYFSRYSRLIMEKEPDLKDFFVIRPLKCEK